MSLAPKPQVCGVWRMKLSSPQAKQVQLYAFPWGISFSKLLRVWSEQLWVSYFMFIAWNAACSIWLTLPFYAFLDGLLKIIYVKPCWVSELRHLCLYRKMKMRQERGQKSTSRMQQQQWKYNCTNFRLAIKKRISGISYQDCGAHAEPWTSTSSQLLWPRWANWTPISPKSTYLPLL